MSDQVVRITWQVPPPYADDPRAATHMRENAQRAFADALLEWLRDHRGGIVSAIHETEERRTDFLFDTGDMTYHTMYANCASLPEPPLFQMLGGPADRHVVRTNGDRYWRIPITTIEQTLAGYGEDPTRMGMTVALYERIGNTGAYRYVRTERA